VVITSGGTLASGTMLDKRYEIKRLIKSGGMGAVYEALDHRFKKTSCAVKEMLSYSTQPKEQQYFISRFQEEAFILHNLRHPNLPGVRDYFVESGRYYLVMDYIEGRDLETVMKDYEWGRVPENLVIEWAIQVLDALEYLHSRNPPVIYRDLKPNNVMLRNSDNKIILIDFGIARTVQPGSDTTKTSIGTPAFAPGEVFEGKPESRSDIYSLGATMHCLLTGRIPGKPFDFSPLNDLNPSVSPKLSSIVMKALEIKIENRYSGAQEMKRNLEEFAEGSSLHNEILPPFPVATPDPGSTVMANLSPSLLSTPGPATDSHTPTTPLSIPSESVTSRSEVPRHPTFPGRKSKVIKKALMTLVFFVLIFALVILALFVRSRWTVYNISRNREIYYKEGDDLIAQKKYEEAIKCYDKALEIDPSSGDVWHGKGIALFNLKRYKEAVACYDEALKFKPDSDGIWCHKGDALLSLGEYKEAVICYDKALEIAPGNGEAAKNKEKAAKQLDYREQVASGDDLFGKGEYDKAIEAYDKALKIVPHAKDITDKKKGALIKRGDELFEGKKYSNAMEYYDKALDMDPDDPVACNMKGRSYLCLKNYDESIKWFDKVLKINPQADWAWFNKGLAREYLKNHDLALKCFDEVLKIDPKDVDAWNNKGGVYFSQGKYDDSIKCYNTVLKLDPNNTLAMDNKGDVYFTLEKYDEALKSYTEALKIDPGQIDPWINKGNIYFNRGSYNDALTCYDKVLGIDPDYYLALYNKGLVYLKQEEYDMSINCYDKALKIKPKDASSWNDKGVAFERLGKDKEAIQCYEKAVEYDPDNTIAKGNLKNLRGW